MTTLPWRGANRIANHFCLRWPTVRRRKAANMSETQGKQAGLNCLAFFGRTMQAAAAAGPRLLHRAVSWALIIRARLKTEFRVTAR